MSATRCGFVALIGAPNAGKSTLINALVGEKVSIVTRKAQTTRSVVRGVMTKGEAQIVFVDTPGLFAPKRRLDRAMVASAWSAAADADVVALMIDARKEGAQASLTEETQAILAGLGERGKPKLAVLNKIDLVQRPKLLELSARLNAATTFDDTFMISAATGDGLERLTKRLIELIPPGPWLYPEDQIAEAPIRSLAAEITREKLIERLHDELPYQATVETESWKDLPDGTARIDTAAVTEISAAPNAQTGPGGTKADTVGLLNLGLSVANASAPSTTVVAPAAAGTPGTIPVAGLAVAIASRAQAGSNQFDIRLDPPELGRIDVRLDLVERVGR